MSSSNKLNFTQGDTPLIVVPITVAGLVQDLTGWVAYFTMTSDPNPTSDSDAAITLQVTLTSTAIAYFQTTETQTSALNAGSLYFWDVKLKDPTGTFFTTITSGTAQINQSYTKRTT